ncbi:MAG: PKD domain-containing protein [Chitinophagales bacterium]|nr:PKD domain-containing protein [Chitinophagales bacterium]MDW8428803.1 PKD domain-containing protein [Chitinophagales bacterium]
MNYWSRLRALIPIIFICHEATAVTFVVTSTHASGPGSLAAAIASANATPEKDTIAFHFAGSSVAARTIVIDKDSLLPNVTAPLVIDGTTQPTGSYFGVSPAKVRIMGLNYPATALAFNAHNCEVYGVWISGFEVAVKVVSCNEFTFGKVNKGNVLSDYLIQGIRFTTSKESNLVGCFIGVDTSGAIGTSPLATGVFVETNSKKVTIGGKSETGRNIISGNYIGIRINESKFITVQQCYVGTDFSGVVSVPNTIGILVNIESDNITIGGDSVKYRNLVSGNFSNGIEFGASSSIIKGNFIGTDVTGSKPLGNGNCGIFLRNQCTEVDIGDTTLYGGNRIAYNGAEGIYFESNLVKNIYIRGNSMYCNSQYTGSGGINVNGGNQGLQPPTLTIVASNFVTGVTYPNVRVDLYSADSCSTCEGAQYLATVLADNNGIFTAFLSISGKVTAVANDPYGNSSAFAACMDTSASSCVYASIFTPTKKTCAYYEVSFTDQSVALPGTTITQRFWDFGDGQTSNASNPVITFSTPGVYSVTLIVQTNNGCTDTAYQTITVYEGVIAMMQLDTVVCLGTPVHFVDLSVAQGSSFITSINWTLGDGNSSSFSDFYYTYPSIGQYSVKLQVTNNLGCSSSANEKIQVRDYPKAKFGVSSTPCMVTPVEFTDLSKPSSGSTLVSWLWNFGDGSSSTVQNPTHLYTASGTYAVTLVVTDQFGCSDDTTVMLEVLAGAMANFSWIVNGLTVTFINNSTFNPEFSVLWNFGDGTSSNLLAPSHTYSSTGSYEVCLVVFDYTCNMSDTLCQTVLVTGMPAVLQSSIRLWPNPAQQLLQLAGPPGWVQLQIRNGLGQIVGLEQVLYSADGNHTVYLPRLPSGSYQLHMRYESFSWVENFVIAP